MLAHDLDVDDCPDFLSPPQRMSVIERARQVQGLAGRRVRRARPSEPRAGTVVPLSVRTLTGGDVGIGRDVRPSYVQVGAGARMYGFTPRGGRALPSIRALDNMDTPLCMMRGGDTGKGEFKSHRVTTSEKSAQNWCREPPARVNRRSAVARSDTRRTAPSGRRRSSCAPVGTSLPSGVRVRRPCWPHSWQRPPERAKVLAVDADTCVARSPTSRTKKALKVVAKRKRTMTEEQRQAVADRMRKYWASRREATAQA